MLEPYLIVGLGNPGERYVKTRHNVGFMVIDEIVARLNGKYKKSNRDFISELSVEDGRFIKAAKPQTYMNRSGETVSWLLEKYQVPLSKLLVVVDDFNLPLGQIRLRRKGSAGGHNGLKSIIETLETNEFPRLRIGIGKDDDFSAIEFVLDVFDTNEQKILMDVIERSATAVLDFVSHGIAKTMNKYNSR